MHVYLTLLSTPFPMEFIRLVNLLLETNMKLFMGMFAVLAAILYTYLKNVYRLLGNQNCALSFDFLLIHRMVIANLVVFPGEKNKK